MLATGLSVAVVAGAPGAAALGRASGAETRAVVVATAEAGARTFYVSPTGNDTATGTSPTSAWQTLARAERQVYRGGDRILLEAGRSFEGSLSFMSESGRAGAPITIGTYGLGRATIKVTDVSASGISIDDGSNWDIDDLDITGPGRAVSRKPGLIAYSATAGRRSHIYVASVAVTGFNQGLVIGAVGATAGFRDVSLASVTASGNADAGIETFGAHAGSITDMRLSGVVASNNAGVPGKTTSTGNGIVLGDVSDTVVQRCVTSHNGSLDVAKIKDGTTKGPAGMWAYDSTGVTFLDNESYDNSTGNGVDGDGFDLDESVTSSTLEYNYSYGNAGAGYLLDGTVANPNRGNTVRYNISEFDGWDSSYAGLEVIGPVTGAEIYNNTVDVVPFPTTFSQPAAIRVDDDPGTVAVRNNILAASGGLAQVEVTGTARGLQFQDNDYWSGGAPPTIAWDTSTYHSLEAWRSATGQERVGARAVGTTDDPRVVNPEGDGVVAGAGQLTTLDSLKLRSTSPLLGAGLNLTGADFRLSVGRHDFWGNPIGSGGTYSIGAGQRPVPVKGDASTRALLAAAGAIAVAGLGVAATRRVRRRWRHRSVPEVQIAG